jgi:hypothetical protein
MKNLSIIQDHLPQTIPENGLVILAGPISQSV